MGKSERFVIIFDELDKISSKQHDKNTDDKSIDFKKLSSRPGQPISSRERKEQVLALVANLKFFLTTANAIFIFIAGRELYESFQNDMSDRDFSISSIFSGILNIDSFLYSSREQNSVSLQTEEFICRQLLPNDYEEKLSKQTVPYKYNSTPSFKNYYLYRAYCKNKNNNMEGNEKYHHIWEEIVQLYHFTSYLTFISNGSPKKITLFFEKYIWSRDYLINIKHTELPHDPDLDNCDPKKVFYLSFGYYSQEKINFFHYMTHSIMSGILNSSNLFGDKLLVSASFLMAYIFKLHNNGFSWRNLEQMPEIQEINKTPEIRDYLGMVIDYMNHSYLVTNPCSLYHYKFPMRFVEEISYHSKLSAEASAIFNFASDELKPIKDKYNKLLEKYTGIPINNNVIYAQASIHHSIGDICMLEENYSGAIREYEYCVELVNSTSPLKSYSPVHNDQRLNYLMFINRSLLKLGLAHEKRRTDNSAYAVYKEMREILCRCKKVSNYEALFEDYRMLHLCILAQLYVLEKLDTTGIEYAHIKKACDDFENIFKKTNILVKADFYRKLGDILYYKNQEFKNENIILRLFSETYSSIKFYKKSLGILLSIEMSDNTFYKKTLKKIQKIITSNNKCNNKHTKDNKLYYIALLCESLGHAYLSISYDEADTVNPDNNKFIEQLYQMVVENSLKAENWECPDFTIKYNIETAIILYWMASYVYNSSCERNLAGRCYRSMIYSLSIYYKYTTKDVLYATKRLKIMKDIIRRAIISSYRQKEYISYAEECALKEIKQLEIFNNIPLNQLSMIPDIESMVYFYYKQELSFWLQNTDDPKRLQNIAVFFRSDFMTKKHIVATLNGTIQMLKLKALFIEAIISVLFTKEIKIEEELKLLEELTFKDLYKLLGEKTTSLRLQNILTEFFPDKTFQNSDEIKRLLNFLISEGNFCLTRILELLDVQRNNTMFIDSFKADIYYKQRIFCRLYDLTYCFYSYGNNPINDKHIEKMLKEQLNIKDLEQLQNIRSYEFREDLKERIAKKMHSLDNKYLSLSFLAERCIYFYARAKQMHNQGKAYQEMIRNLYFLEEDLNNDTIQFNLAVSKRYVFSKDYKKRNEHLINLYKEYRNYDITKYIETFDQLDKKDVCNE